MGKKTGFGGKLKEAAEQMGDLDLNNPFWRIIWPKIANESGWHRREVGGVDAETRRKAKVDPSRRPPPSMKALLKKEKQRSIAYVTSMDTQISKTEQLSVFHSMVDTQERFEQ